MDQADRDLSAAIAVTRFGQGGLVKGVRAESLGVDRRALDAVAFPHSAGAPGVRGLVWSVIAGSGRRFRRPSRSNSLI